MFGTIIQDAYKKHELNEIVDALGELCNPNDTYGWASAGIYCFWDYHTKEVLYIGLAVDLTERFKQHNGIIPMDLNACKYEQITSYFEEREKIGYSVFLQSPLSQPVVRKNIYKWFNYNPEEFSIADFTNEQSKNDLRRLEGILIEAFRQKHGALPKWNRVSGSIDGQRATLSGNYEIIRDMTNQRLSPLVSRSTLRELASNPTYTWYENFIHGIRQMILFFGMSFNEALPFILKTDSLKTYERIEQEAYLKKTFVL
ncbi:GIY-YIG nuclease family protein [Ornithinibacillus salinisoli]|uniref:GIY-YIG nuclease family protein n=1 Tax=Ornithinibacillus salinisoli TaxID=1848459 RepID=A0ABW4W7Z7_9BACI